MSEEMKRVTGLWMLYEESWLGKKNVHMLAQSGEANSFTKKAVRGKNEMDKDEINAELPPS